LLHLMQSLVKTAAVDSCLAFCVGLGCRSGFVSCFICCRAWSRLLQWVRVSLPAWGLAAEVGSCLASSDAELGQDCCSGFVSRFSRGSWLQKWVRVLLHLMQSLVKTAAVGSCLASCVGLGCSSRCLASSDAERGSRLLQKLVRFLLHLMHSVGQGCCRSGFVFCFILCTAWVKTAAVGSCLASCVGLGCRSGFVSCLI
jgi:hypothetical protein